MERGTSHFECADAKVDTIPLLLLWRLPYAFITLAQTRSLPFLDPLSPPSHPPRQSCSGNLRRTTKNQNTSGSYPRMSWLKAPTGKMIGGFNADERKTNETKIAGQSVLLRLIMSLLLIMNELDPHTVWSYFYPFCFAQWLVAVHHE